MNIHCLFCQKQFVVALFKTVDVFFKSVDLILEKFCGENRNSYIPAAILTNLAGDDALYQCMVLLSNLVSI